MSTATTSACAGETTGGGAPPWRARRAPPATASPAARRSRSVDGSNISFDYACSYAAEQQSCACNDSKGFGTFYCGCPAALPAEGSACIGPSPCSYGGVTCNCSAGHWQCGAGACPTNETYRGRGVHRAGQLLLRKDGGTDFCACDGTAWSCS